MNQTMLWMPDQWEPRQADQQPAEMAEVLGMATPDPNRVDLFGQPVHPQPELEGVSQQQLGFDEVAEAKETLAMATLNRIQLEEATRAARADEKEAAKKLEEVLEAHADQVAIVSTDGAAGSAGEQATATPADGSPAAPSSKQDDTDAAAIEAAGQEGQTDGQVDTAGTAEADTDETDDAWREEPTAVIHLEKVPRLGATTIERIIQQFPTVGKLMDAMLGEELLKTRGVGRSTYDGIKDRIEEWHVERKKDPHQQAAEDGRPKNVGLEYTPTNDRSDQIAQRLSGLNGSPPVKADIAKTAMWAWTWGFNSFHAKAKATSCPRMDHLLEDDWLRGWLWGEAGKTMSEGNRVGEGLRANE